MVIVALIYQASPAFHVLRSSQLSVGCLALLHCPGWFFIWTEFNMYVRFYLLQNPKHVIWEQH